MTDPAFFSARRLATMVRRRAIGCVELFDHFIARIERHDPRLNAVVVRDIDRARERAKKLDRAQGALGPLHGVPMTVKESYDIEGLPTTWGVPEKRGQIAGANALVVQRLLDAGAVVFGKTNVPVMLSDWQSFNAIYGSTGNPWDLSRAPGGSSGGSAAALAAGLTGLECGSDIGGSIRQPAHACGVFGHKPTWGLIPPRGHAPAPGIAGMTDISVVGPLARSAEDLSTALDLLARPDESETGMRYRLPRPRVATLRGLRVAIWAREPAAHTDAEASIALEALGRHLRRAGAKVSLTARPDLDPRTAMTLYLQLLGAALSGRATPEERAAAAARHAGVASDDISAGAMISRGALASHAEWIALNERRSRMRRAWGAFFQDWDVLLCPAFGVAAQTKVEDRAPQAIEAVVNGVIVDAGELFFWPGIIGAVHLPATVAPLGLTQAGLPMGVQIVGPLFGDLTTIAVARMLERDWRSFEPPPGWD